MMTFLRRLLRRLLRRWLDPSHSYPPLAPKPPRIAWIDPARYPLPDTLEATGWHRPSVYNPTTGLYETDDDEDRTWED